MKQKYANQAIPSPSVFKKIMLICTAFSFMVFGGACVTSSVLKSKSYHYKNYTETVSSFLVSADKKKIVVLGKERHYLFDFNPQLQGILGSQLNNKITADFKTFTLDTNKVIVNGRFQLKVDNKLVTADDMALLKKLGFMKRPAQGETVEWYSRQYLKGTYYRAGNFKLPQNSRYLNQTYEVAVRERTEKNNAASKVLLTPLALAADGVLMIGAIPFLIIGGTTH